MRPCSTCLALRSSFSRAPSLVRPLSRHTQQQLLCLTKRSTASASSPSGIEPLTVLHKAVALLPRVPCYAQDSGSQQDAGSSHVWESILSGAYDDLSAVADRPVKIVVLGLDEWSRSQDLVTALLADPLSSNEKHIAQLSNRWSEPSIQKVEIIYGPEQDVGPPPFKSSSAFLTQFPVPIQLAEFRAPTKSSSVTPSVLQIFRNSAIHQADIAVIIFNPITTPLSTVLSAVLPTNTIFVVTSTASQADLGAIVQQYLSSVPSPRRLHRKSPEIVSADPRRAVDAIKAIQGQHNSLAAIQKFQDDFIGSNIAEVTHALQRRLTGKQPFISVRKNMAICRINDAFQWSSANILQSRDALDQAFIDVSTLRQRLEEIQAKAEIQVFEGHDRDASEKLELNAVDEAIHEAELELKDVMDNLSWWRMIWRVDEISTIVGAALKETWCRNLEKKLILSTGNLSATQKDISESTLALLTKHRAVNTAVLRNTLLQYKTSLSYSLAPDSLTRPILLRRNQLIAYPTMRLHVAGQRAVLGMVGGTMSSIGISWAGWMGWLLGTGEGLIGFASLDPGTAIALGMLTGAASVRWAIGLWEKSKKRWWEDWRRVGEGLDRDLKVDVRDSASFFVH
ncbi:hypothetical protein CPB84DRAFT_1896922 [Gymnopilus junonius]|uniref:Mmc1 C-terminal domain-containing protein n=1 Tax=Gymnopilus junonius TaxID=109634 RepID=A0A9P5NS08_GYMJU|nr:hypothetical protein CPB84DRAFT_1896922 [Gymnopilus junonius]